MYESFPVQLLPCIESFFATESTRQPGQDSYPDVFSTSLFFPLQRQRELATMMRIARNYSPRVVYEIGADKGGGLYHWCKSLPTVERVIACEIRGTPYRHFFEQHFPHIDFLWIEESSFLPAVRAKVARWLGNDRLQALFIDGDKSNFATDFDTYREMMDKPSVVFMHDIQDRSTGDSFESVALRGYHTEKVIDTSESYESMSREKEGLPATCEHEHWLRHWQGASAGVGVIYIKD